MISNEELGVYLKNIREKLGYSTHDVNKSCGISQSYISLMENGKRKPSPIILKKLASIYYLNYIDLYEKAGYIDLIEDEKDELLKKIGAIPLSSENMVNIPVLGTVKAGYDYLAQENWIGTIQVKAELIENGEEYFALKIKGDSMAPVFIEGDIVIIKKQNDCENNEYAVVIVNGEEGMLKKVKKTDSGIILQPLNPAYGPVMYTFKEIEDVPILIAGVVKQLQREF